MRPKAGERVLASLTRFLTERLKFKVNTAKSAVAPAWERKFFAHSCKLAPGLESDGLRRAVYSGCAAYLNWPRPNRQGLVSLLDSVRRLQCVS